MTKKNDDAKARSPGGNRGREFEKPLGELVKKERKVKPLFIRGR